MSREEEAADVLDKAHDILLVDGWCQKALHSEDGHCALGAISKAAPLYLTGNRQHVDACRALTSTIDPDGFSGVDIPHWNDLHCHSVDDVLDGFRQASKKLRNGDINL